MTDTTTEMRALDLQLDQTERWLAQFDKRGVADAMNAVAAARAFIALSASQPQGDVAELVGSEIDKLIEDAPVDGLSADGEYNDRIKWGQGSFVSGLRVARLQIMNLLKALPHSDGAVAEPVAWRYRAKGSHTWQRVTEVEPKKARWNDLDIYEISPLYASPINPVPAGVGVREQADELWEALLPYMQVADQVAGKHDVYADKVAALSIIERAFAILRQAPDYTPQILEMDREGDPCWEFVERDCLTITGEVFAANVEQIFDADHKLIGFRIYKKRAALRQVPDAEQGRWAPEKYAEQLVVSLREKHYPEVQQFQPMSGNIMGLLSQIDNMLTALVRAPTQDRG